MATAYPAMFSLSNWPTYTSVYQGNFNIRQHRSWARRHPEYFGLRQPRRKPVMGGTMRIEMRSDGLSSKEISLTALGDEQSLVNLLSLNKAKEMVVKFDSMVSDGAWIQGLGKCYGKVRVRWWLNSSTSSREGIFYVVHSCPGGRDAIVQTSSRDSFSSTDSDSSYPLEFGKYDKKKQAVLEAEVRARREAEKKKIDDQLEAEHQARVKKAKSTTH